MRRLVHPCSHVILAGSNNGGGAPQQPPYSSGSSVGVSTHLNPNPPSNAYYPNSRTRANTINHMDRIPPALARLQHMSQDVISGRNALTPVLNRDDAIKEWERRQSGKAAAPQPYPQLEYLQQQAELVGASGIASWQQPATRYQPAQGSGLAHQYHPPSAIVVDDERRDAIMSNVRATAQGQGYISNPISNPPAAYTGSATSAGNRFAVTYPQQASAGSQSQSQQHSQPSQQHQQPQQQQSPTSPFDSLDRRPDMGGLFVPLQPDHFQPYSGTSVAGGRGAVAPSAVPPSFYDPAVAQQTNAAPQRNLFSGDASSAGGSAPVSGSTNITKDRRGSGMEFWPR
jgi:dual specificity protein kinase YAK1